ncbi:MAG: caspase family protein [Bacteroidetes bacterium]|nr:caspase family protein [Bacteroidota bacterium]
MNRKFLQLFILLFIINSLSAQDVKLVVPQGHAKHVEQLFVTPDGRYLASVAYKTAIVWDRQADKKLYELTLPTSMVEVSNVSLGLSKNLDKLMVCTTYGAYLYSFPEGKELVREEGGSKGALLSAGEKFIYNIDDSNIELLDVTNGRSVRSFNNVLEGLQYGKGSKMYEDHAKNELVVITGRGWLVLDLGSGITRLKKNTTDIGELSSFSYDPAEGVLVAAIDAELLTFNIYSGKLLKRKSFAGNILSATVINGKEIAIFYPDFKNHSFRTDILNIRDLSLKKSVSRPESEVPELIFYANCTAQIPGKPLLLFNNNNQLEYLNTDDGSIQKAFSSRVTDYKQFYYMSSINQHPVTDSTLSLETDDNGNRSFSPETFRPESFSPGPERPIWSPDGRFTAGIGDKITLTDNSTGKVIRTLPLPAGIIKDEDYFFFGPDNNIIIYASRGTGSVGGINIQTGLASKYFSTPASFFLCTASLDGKYFICLNSDNDYYNRSVYDLSSMKLVNSGPIKTIPNPQSIEFLNGSHDYVVIGQKGEVCIYSVTEHEKETNFTIPNYNQLRLIGCDLSNDLLAFGETALYQEATYNLKFYHRDGTFIKTIDSRENAYFMKAAFFSGGKLMLAPTTKKGIEAWNLQTGEYLGTYYLFANSNEYLFITPEGLFDGSMDGMKELYLVKDFKPIPLDNLFETYYTPDILRRKLNGEKFSPPDISGLATPPSVRISYEAAQRNLEVEYDLPTYHNTTGTAVLTVSATAPGNSIQELRLFHNGKIVNLATRNLVVDEDQKPESISKKYTLDLLPGMNTFRAVALNVQRTESRPDEISVIYDAGNTSPDDTPANPAATPGKNTTVSAIDRNATLYLVVIGINEYQNKKMCLNYARADATAFKEEMEKDAVSVIANTRTSFITDAEANQHGIESAMDEISKKAKPEDVFVFYYAGHGVIGKDQEFYLVPNDVSDLHNVQAELEQKGIAARILQQYAGDIRAQKQLFILDACQSAGAFSEMMTASANQQKNIAVVARTTGTHWIAASGAQQYANEFSQLGHGVFTYVLLQAMQGSAAVNKLITVNNLKDYLQKEVPSLMKKYSGTQQFPASYGFGNDFPVEKLN